MTEGEENTTSNDVSDDQRDSFISGIPKSEFIENVEEFIKRNDNESVDQILKRLDELHQKYRFTEAQLVGKRSRLKTQVPDIKHSLDLIDELSERKESAESMKANFLLNDQLYATAEIPPTDTVHLWLGANVMMEYPLDDAKCLLTKNYETAQSNIKKINNDLDFLRDQITTTEVSMARVYNFDVQRRKATKSS